MSDPARAVPVASIILRDPYQAPGFDGRYLHADRFVMAYEEDTNQMAVMPKSTRKAHVIPWANILGFELATEAPPEVKTEANGAGPARPTGGGTRRARPAQ
jgi:hypothetical protein